MVGDMMDDAMGESDEEEEVEEQVNKVLAEIGLDFADGVRRPCIHSCIHAFTSCVSVGTCWTLR